MMAMFEASLSYIDNWHIRYDCYSYIIYMNNMSIYKQERVIHSNQIFFFPSSYDSQHSKNKIHTLECWN